MFIIFLISFQNTSYLGIAHGTHHRQAVFYRNTVKISPVSLSMQIGCFCNDIDSWDLGALQTGQWGTNSRGPSLLFCSAAHRAFYVTILLRRVAGEVGTHRTRILQIEHFKNRVGHPAVLSLTKCFPRSAHRSTAGFGRKGSGHPQGICRSSSAGRIQSHRP